MNSNGMVRFPSFAAVVMMVINLPLAAQDPDKGFPDSQSLKKTSGSPIFQVLNINNITAWQRSDGRIWGSPNGEPSTIYPKNTVSAIYGGGIIWGGNAYLDPNYSVSPPGQSIRLGGHVRASARRAGRIVGSGPTATG